MLARVFIDPRAFASNTVLELFPYINPALTQYSQNSLQVKTLFLFLGPLTYPLNLPITLLLNVFIDHVLQNFDQLLRILL